MGADDPFAERGPRGGSNLSTITPGVASCLLPWVERRSVDFDTQAASTALKLGYTGMMSDGQQNKLVSEPPIAAPDEYAQLVQADQRFRAALAQAIAKGGERVEAMQATVDVKRRTKPSG